MTGEDGVTLAGVTFSNTQRLYGINLLPVYSAESGVCAGFAALSIPRVVIT